MNRINRKRSLPLVIGGLLAVSLTAASNAGASEVQVGRYQSVVLQPDQQQVDLLSVLVTRELPEHINTVGQAVTLLLDGSGYRLLSADLAGPYRALLFALPLPQVQRQLGPLSLRQALELLTGPAFRLVIDPTYRLVSFELLAISPTSEAHVCSPE